MVPILRFLPILALAPLLGACITSSSSSRAAADGTTVTVNQSSASVSGPGVSAGAGAALVTVAPTAGPSFDQSLLGVWTLARSGDRVCMVDLGTRSAAGDFVARTRRCTSIELARIAFWKPDRGSIILYDFEGRSVVAFKPTGENIYEGLLWDGTRVTLWR